VGTDAFERAADAAAAAVLAGPPLRMAPAAARRRTKEAFERIDKLCGDAWEDALARDAAADAKKRLEFLRRRPTRRRRFTRWDKSIATSDAAKKAEALFAKLEAYQPWTDETEVAQYDALAEEFGWDKTRFGAYGVTPARTVARVLDALRSRGARPEGAELVVLGSSVGWVAFGLALLLPRAARTIGLEILGTRVYEANVAASLLNGVREVQFVLGNVVEQAEEECRRAALIWDSLGYGAENGGRTEGLAGATRGAPPGCVLVTYDVLPDDPRLERWRQLGEAIVLPNSWTARQRYYLYALDGEGPPLQVARDPKIEAYRRMLSTFKNRDMVVAKMKYDGVDPSLLDPPLQSALAPLVDEDAPAAEKNAQRALLALLHSHEGFAHPDKATPDKASPEELSAITDDFARVLGTDSIRGFL